MSDDDRRRWDARHERADRDLPIAPPTRFAPYEDLFPTSGRALDVACGTGRFAIWISQRGLTVWGIDVSPVAIGLARELAVHAGVDDRCHFDVVDLDGGLPQGPPVDLVVCHLFRDPRLDPQIVDRLLPGGLLAIAALSEVGAAAAGSFHIPAGALRSAFADLEVITEGEGDGQAWLLGRRPSRP